MKHNCHVYIYSTRNFMQFLLEYIYIYIYAQTGTFADPTVRCFKAFVDLCTFVRFFLGVSRRFFFLQLRIKPIQGIRVKSVGWAHSTGSFGTSLTILFQSCEHRKKSWTTMQPCSCQNLDFPKQSIPKQSIP